MSDSTLRTRCYHSGPTGLPDGPLFSSTLEAQDIEADFAYCPECEQLGCVCEELHAFHAMQDLMCASCDDVNSEFDALPNDSDIGSRFELEDLPF